MAQKTSFGVRMCLLSILSVKIERRWVKIPKILLNREIQATTKTSENTLKLLLLTKYTNRCNTTLNLTQIETKKYVHYYLNTYTVLKMHIGVLFHRPITDEQYPTSASNDATNRHSTYYMFSL